MKSPGRVLDLVFAIATAACVYWLVYYVLDVADIGFSARDSDGRHMTLPGLWNHALPASLALNAFFLARLPRRG